MKGLTLKELFDNKEIRKEVFGTRTERNGQISIINKIY